LLGSNASDLKKITSASEFHGITSEINTVQNVSDTKYTYNRRAGIA
jgi:hypothetical protein